MQTENQSSQQSIPTSHWNYRLVKKNGWFELYEVYYSNGVITGWCEADLPSSETIEEFAEELAVMTNAARRPFLTMVDNKLV